MQGEKPENRKIEKKFTILRPIRTPKPSLGGRWHGAAVTDEGKDTEKTLVGVDALIDPACALVGFMIGPMRASAPTQIVGVSEKIKTWGAEAPQAPRISRSTSNYDLHEKAGGLPLLNLTAPSVHPTTQRRREVCKQNRKSNFPSKKCGSKRTCQRTKQEENKFYSSSSESSS